MTVRWSVFDLEANGLLNSVNMLDDADRIWCGVFKQAGGTKTFEEGNLEYMLPFMSRIQMLIGHNICDYDIPLLKKIYNFELSPKTVVIDTYLWSQMLWPDLDRHPKCSKGPHSLENWGWKFGRQKPEHEDWSRYSPEMLHRCTEDVEINYLLFQKINEEAGIIDTKLDGSL